MFRRIVSISILGALSVILLGCGEKGGADLARVKGKVLYNSQPLAGATLTSSPATVASPREQPIPTGSSRSARVGGRARPWESTKLPL